MVDALSIVSSIVRQGYATERIDPELRKLAFDFSAAFYRLPASQRIRFLVSPQVGLTGYMPSEDELEVLRRSGQDIPEWIKSLKRPRGYSSLDAIPPQCTQLTESFLFRTNPDFDALGLSTEDYSRISSGLNEFATSICKKLAESWDHSFDIAKYSDHPVSSSSYGLTRFLKYSAANEQRISKPHTDYELLTVILADGPGLEVQSVTGEWARIEWNPSDAVIIPGDMFEVVSRGRIKAAMHRVSILDSDRHSITFFKGPGLEFQLSNSSNSETMPRDFREHVISMQIRSAPHLQDSIDHLATTLGIRIPASNPFRRVL